MSALLTGFKSLYDDLGSLLEFCCQNINVSFSDYQKSTINRLDFIMIKSLTSFFNQLLDTQVQNKINPTDSHLAIAALLCQVTQADHNIDQAELNAQTQMLIKLLHITEQEAEQLLSQASVRSEKSASLYEFTDKLRELDHQRTV